MINIFSPSKAVVEKNYVVLSKQITFPTPQPHQQSNSVFLFIAQAESLFHRSNPVESKLTARKSNNERIEIETFKVRMMST